MLKHKTEYIDLGETYYEKEYQQRFENNLKKKADMLGYELVKKEVKTDASIMVH